MFIKILIKKLNRKDSENKNKQFLFVNFIDLLSKYKRKKCVKYLKGNTIVSDYEGQDCIILFFKFKHFQEAHLRLLSRIIFFVDRKKIFFSSERVRIKVIDNIKKGKRYNYLRPKGKLILSVD